MADRILLEKDAGGIYTLTLNTPPLNLQTLQSMECLEKIVRELKKDVSVRVLIVIGSGTRAFCAGSDVKEFPHLRGNFVEEKLRRENAVFNAIASFDFPVIAALNGSAMGGGAELALCCDFRIMSREAKIAFPEIMLGNFPGSGGILRLTRLLGSSAAFELMGLGDVLDAEAAVRIGLVNTAVEAEQVLNTARQLAERLAKKPKYALSCIKKAVYAAPQQSAAEAVDMSLQMTDFIFGTEDCREGIAAFLEKRPPDFR